MPSRTPSFIVVGLVIIMFLLGFFYMSCSSTTAELRQTLGEFEDRVRSLTLKNSDNERKIEIINTSKRELEEEKLNIQRQMEKKDSEINDLNTRLNEKATELQSLKSDKQVLEEQLKECKNLSDTLASKNSVIDKKQQEFDEQKKYNENQLNDLKQQIENYKQQLNQSQNNQEKLPVISNQRFQPLLSANETIGNSSANLGQELNDPDLHQRRQRSVNDSLIDIDNVQKTVNLTSIIYLNETNISNNQSQLLSDNRNNHEQVPLDQNDDEDQEV